MKRHFPLSLQHDSMQCGVACLKMICEYYGRTYSFDFLNHYCFATTEGVSLLGISEAAGKLGLHTLAGRVVLKQLAEAPLPCILHWNQNHFVVLYKVKKNRTFYIADPGKGLLTYTQEEMEEHWVSTRSNGEEKGIALFLEKTPSFGETTREDVAENGVKERHSFYFLFGYIRKYHQYFGQILLGLLTGCVLQLIFPFLTQSIVDVGITQKNLSFIWLVLLGQLALTVGRTAIDFIRRWILLHIGMRINISLVSDFFIKLLKLPMTFFDTKLMGDLMQRMNDHQRVEDFLTNQTLSVMFSFLSFIVLGAVLLWYNGLIFIMFLAGSILYGVWMGVFLRQRKLLDYLLFEEQAENNNKTYEFITSIQEIKLQNCEQRRRWEWEDVQADLFGVQMKSLRLKQSQEAGCLFINEVKNMLITVMAATAVIHGNMTLGMMLAVQYITGQLNAPVEQLMGFIYSLQDVKISLERINEIHTMQDEATGRRNTASFPTTDRSLRLFHVSFKYDPHALKETLSEVGFTIPSGKVTAIVGTSGSGKTTLIKLMLGYYPVSSGRITVGGVDINDLDLKWWRRQCGVVMQEGVIFSESIARNIAVDDGEIDRERLLRAVEIAHIKDYILQLPLKFNTKIGRDGIGLSRGQQQRILIARAVYKDPAFIFLDEATNSLDANNERAIVDDLNTFYKGRTVIVVAHRLSTVRNADNIIVIDRGHIVETGNHTTLIEKKGAYYRLVKNQLELGN